MDYPPPDVEELNLPENKEFVAYLRREIDGFLKSNGNSKAVMLFPPFNSYKRLLLHHLVESSYGNCGLSTFSIGQEPRRRTVVCLGSLRKGVLEDDANDSKAQRSRPRVTPKAEDRKAPARHTTVSTSESADAKPPERQRKARKTMSYYVPPHLRKASLDSEPMTKKEKTVISSDGDVSGESTAGAEMEISQLASELPPTVVENKMVVGSVKSPDMTGDVWGEWDPLFCGKGKCSVPNLVIPILDESEMSDITNEVGCVRIVEIIGPTVEESSDSCDYINGTMIEIYDLPEDVTTNDLAQIFGAYVGRGFRLRWVDTSHALGIFSSSKAADEALASEFSRVKIRPISEGTSLSQEIARNVVLPSSFRPKTCSSLAKRLLSGALGLKVSPLSAEERAARSSNRKQ